MEMILLDYGLPNETAIAIMMLYKKRHKSLYDIRLVSAYFRRGGQSLTSLCSICLLYFSTCITDLWGRNQRKRIRHQTSEKHNLSEQKTITNKARLTFYHRIRQFKVCIKIKNVICLHNNNTYNYLIHSFSLQFVLSNKK